MFVLYRYQTLATTTDEKANDENVASGKRLVADWVLGLGEPASQIEVIVSSNDSDDVSCKIVVLGLRNVFVLHHTGVLVALKPLDFTPVTMLTYPSGMFVYLDMYYLHFLKKLLKYVKNFSNVTKEPNETYSQ